MDPRFVRRFARPFARLASPLFSRTFPQWRGHVLWLGTASSIDFCSYDTLVDTYPERKLEPRANRAHVEWIVIDLSTAHSLVRATTQHAFA